VLHSPPSIAIRRAIISQGNTSGPTSNFSEGPPDNPADAPTGLSQRNEISYFSQSTLHAVCEHCRNMILPFPLFHGTSDIFLPSIRRHGLSGKNIIVEWRVLDFLRIVMGMLGSHVDRSDLEVSLKWRILEAAAEQRVDHLNWRHGATYLIAAEFRAVMYATSGPYGSELLYLVGWLIELCPPELRTALDRTVAGYPEIAKCLSTTGNPLVVRAEHVPMKSLRTEKGADASKIVRQLADAHTMQPELFEGLAQIGSFELCNPLPVEQLRFYQVSEYTKFNYRLEEIIL
jgi:hypothetical protein